jgi:hypothetical protein
MTTSQYSTNFKLIRAYKKYSPIYKNCTVQHQRLVLYQRWTQEITETAAHEITDNVTSFKQQNWPVYCELCTSETIANEYLCCIKCLFPIVNNLNCELTAQQQLNLFALLSVCYWEEKLNNNNFTDKKLEENTKLIWTHRLRMAWLSSKKNFVCFLANSTVCTQCNRNNFHIMKYYSCKLKLQNFNVNYFCQDCLFPLFDKLIYI